MEEIILMELLITVFVIAILSSCLLTPFMIKFGYFINAVDEPGGRRVHKKAVPRIGGIALILSFSIVFIIISQFIELNYGILLAVLVIGVTGLVDDFITLSPLQKILGQGIAAAIVIFMSGISIQYISMPFQDYGVFIPSLISIPITFIWIIAITNAINLIDGLDGLAAGVSGIAAVSIFALAVLMGNWVVAFLSIAIIGAVIGFLFFNFHPAKIFMGDSGALFLGFILAVVSLMGFKQVTTISLLIPFLILGVPIIDTVIAIIRRAIHNQPITNADKSHLHHKLLEFGYSHKQTVLIIYSLAIIFGVAAVAFSQVSSLGSTIIFIGLVVLIEVLIEKFSLISQSYRPILQIVEKLRKKKLGNKRYG
jgi:UDP-GlcNAc:undecaprenyl-phosphate GlcNAc-1-phosphate transferase